MKQDIYFDEHALLRMAQRNISKADVLRVIKVGEKIHRTGVVFFFMGNKNIPDGKEKTFESLVGTTVIQFGNKIRTVYRNSKAIRKIKRKPKRRKKFEKQLFENLLNEVNRQN